MNLWEFNFHREQPVPLTYEFYVNPPPTPTYPSHIFFPFLGSLRTCYIDILLGSLFAQAVISSSRPLQKMNVF